MNMQFGERQKGVTDAG